MSSFRRSALAVGVFLAVALSACSSPAEEGEDGEDKSPASRLELSVPAAGDARCMVPNAEVIGRAEKAFEGVVTDVSEESATLEVTRWIHGVDETSEVVVATPDVAGTSVAGVEFEKSATYLVSATGSEVTLCGMSGKKTAELEALYDEAFAH